MNLAKVQQEIRHSLPSKQLLKVSSNLAVEHPHTKELIFIKQRHPDTAPSSSDFVRLTKAIYSENGQEYDQYFGKSVIVEDSALSRRGKEALAFYGLFGKNK